MKILSKEQFKQKMIEKKRYADLKDKLFVTATFLRAMYPEYEGIDPRDQ